MGGPVQPSVWARVGRLSGDVAWQRVWVAYSGGADSQALLALLAADPQRPAGRLRAVHVVHHLHPDCHDWAAHCRQCCDALGVPLDVIAVTVGRAGGIEAAARDARYSAWRNLLAVDDLLCTAHHRDDQAETVLLRLLRGSGIDGLVGMPARRKLGQGWLLRPLLDVSRETLRCVNAHAGLAVIDDPANADTAFDRVFLRRQILPKLAERWPAVVDSLVAVAAAAAESSALTAELARLDGLEDGSLACDSLRRLDPPRQANLVRAWLRGHGLRPPGRRQLQAGLVTMLDAASDRQPSWVWADGMVRRYRGRLYVETRRTPPADSHGTVLNDAAIDPLVDGRTDGNAASGDARCMLPTTLAAAQQLSLAQGVLHLAPVTAPHPAHATCIAVEALHAGLSVDRRRPGDRCRVAAAMSRSLKNLLREAGMLPWWRPRWPVLRSAAGEVIAVPGVCVAHAAVPPPETPAIAVWFEPSHCAFNCAMTGDLLPFKHCGSDLSDRGRPG